MPCAVSWQKDEVFISGSSRGLKVKLAPRWGPEDLKCDVKLGTVLAHEVA